MSFITGDLGYRLLKVIAPPRQRQSGGGQSYESPNAKLRTHFGNDVFDRLQGKSVIDFGCGVGREAIEIAKQLETQVVGVELRDDFRETATLQATQAGVSENCQFVRSTETPADVVISLDAFEHFDDPAAILNLMSELLTDNGQIWISFGWTWYHPRGGHAFSVFPWAHLVFAESALIRWRADFNSDGATRFHEVAGGLNQMTIGRFEAIVADSCLRLDELCLRPIRCLRAIHCRLTREFTTSLILARLSKRPE